MLTMRPHWRCFMPGAKAALMRNTLSRLIASTRRQSSNVIFIEGLIGKNAGAIYEDVAAAKMFSDVARQAP